MTTPDSTPISDNPFARDADSGLGRGLGAARLMILASLILVPAFAVWSFLFVRQAELETALMAQHMCTCSWVDNRDFSACAAEAPIPIDKYKVEFTRYRVHVSGHGLTHGVSIMTPGYGCAADKWVGL